MLDGSLVVAAFGELFLNTGQGFDRLFELMNFKSATDMLGTAVVTDADVWQGSTTTTDEILQPFQSAWTPKGTEVFTPTEIRSRRIKADKIIVPDSIRESWLGFLVNEGLNREDYPLVQYLIERVYIPAIKNDYETKVIYKGIYAAPTPGTAGAANTSMDGIGKVIADNITAGRITPIVTGAFSANRVTFVGQIEDFTDAISDRYWGEKMFLAMSPANAKKYARGYKEKYGQVLSYNEKQRYEVDNANIEVVGLPSMIGVNRIWATTDANFVRIYKETQAANTIPIQIQSVDRSVKIFSDFARGVGFQIPEAVFVNDQV